MSLVLRVPSKMHLCRSSSNASHLPTFLTWPQNPRVLLTLDKVCNSLRLPHKTTLQPLKVARTCGVFGILTSTCASRHKGPNFSTSQRPRVPHACRFLTWMQLFQRLHFEKRSEAELFCRFDLEMCFAPIFDGKNHNASRLFQLFARFDLLSPDSFSSVTSSLLSVFSSSSSLRCCCICP